MHTAQVTVQELRKLLGVMTKNPDVGSHPAEIERLRRLVPHTIEVASDGMPLALGDYNCFAYALGLTELSKFQEFELHGINTNFIERLIRKSLLVDAAEGNCVVYFNPRPWHAGRVSRGRVVSKWGLGHLYEHEMMEVPADYGDDPHFMASTSLDTIVDELRKHLMTPEKYF